MSSKSSGVKRGGAVFVAAGIFLSRIAGLVRVRVFAHFLGNSLAADAFNLALKIPNFLQNLFGEGVLSASFIPVYSKLLAEGETEEANRVAGAVAGLLALVASVLALIGVLLTPVLVDLIAPGFESEKRALAISLVRICFPGTALLVMSAWCLGILNSHRRFFLSYVAPVVWNLTIISALVVFGGAGTQSELAFKVAWGLVLGSFLQLVVQLPMVFKLIGRLRLSLSAASHHVRTVIKNFSTVVVARGVVQVSAYIDNILASLLPTGALSTIVYAQTIYLLPVSLFGMSVSAANLPEMSGALGTEEVRHKRLREQLARGLGQISFFIIPSMAAMIFLGDVIVAGLFQTGAFGRDEVVHVWGTMAGFAVGLLASTLGRLYSSTYYALQDTRTPLKFALARVFMATSLGYIAAIKVVPALGFDPQWGTVGITLMSASAGWLEFALLKSSLNRRIGKTVLELKFLAKVWFAALLATAVGWGVRRLVEGFTGHDFLHPVVMAVLVFSVYGGVYFGAGIAMGLPQAKSLIKRLK